MKTVYLVRHGESTTNVGGPILGAATPLTNNGRAQAVTVAERCTRIPIDVIISSTHVRARETAEAVSAKVSKPIEFSDLFVEWDRGSHRIGRSVDDTQLKNEEKAIFEHFVEPGWRAADEENFEDLNERAASALTYLENRVESSILVAGHGLFTRILVGRAVMGEDFTGRDCLHFLRAFKTENTGISVLQFDSPSGAQRWNLVTWNDHAHLG